MLQTQLTSGQRNFLFIWFGLWSIGAKAAFINYNLTGAPLLHSIKTSTARLLLADEDIKPALTEEVRKELSSESFRTPSGSVEIVYFSDALEQELAGTKPIREPNSCRGGQTTTSIAMLIYTSGTTGNPKPALIPWTRMTSVVCFVPCESSSIPPSFFEILLTASAWLKLTKEDIFYTCMPLYHSAGSILASLNAMSIGATLSLGHKFGTQTFWTEVRDSKATYIQYVGETCRYLLAAKPSPLDKQNCVKAAFGNGLRPDIWDTFKERFGIETINEFYAATEGVGSSWNRSRNSLTKGAVGRAGKFVRWYSGGAQALVEHDIETESPLKDPETGFCKRIDHTLPNAPPGELLGKLPDIKEEREATYQGYFRDEKATNSKILRDVFVKGDAYYRTGDMVRISQEGFVYFHDRIGDTFRWKSENVSTNEVAEVISSHPAVAEANVYGVALPNHDGRAGCVAIVLKNPDGSEKANSTDVDQHTLSELARHARDNLPRYAVPLFLRFPREMQRTGNNKQQKHHLRSEGVEPDKVAPSGDTLYWLNGGTYKPYGKDEWETIKGGKVKL